MMHRRDSPEPATIIDELAAIAAALERIAEAIEHHNQLEYPPENPS